MSVHLEGDQVRLEEEHRFVNEPTGHGDELVWDVDRLWEQTLVGLGRAADSARQHRIEPSGIAVDSWGVDFGLVDEAGALVGPVRHYRSATGSAMHAVQTLVPAADLFARNGITPMPINTVYRLPPALADRDAPGLSMLLTADLWTFRLSGVRSAELTMAGTTGLLDITARQWDVDLARRLGIDPAVLPGTARSGTRAGSLLPIVAQRIGALPDLPVMRTAGHDTAAAVAAIPGRGHVAFVSCGTWALAGVQTDRPVLTREALDGGFTNEIGADGEILLMRNLTGLWLLDEAVRRWRRTDPGLVLEPLLAQARALDAFTSVFDVGDPVLPHSRDTDAEIRRLCRMSGQQVPESAPEMVRCILQSLAAAFARTVEDCERLTGSRFDRVHLVGGGARNALLCRLVAHACGRELLAGPAEATSLGNALVQARGCGDASSAQQSRDIVAASYPPTRYPPDVPHGH
jgi:rhamnulokinase